MIIMNNNLHICVVCVGHQWSKVPLEHHSPCLRWHKVSAEGIFEDKGQLWLLSTAGDIFSSCANFQTVHVIILIEDTF
jgi:hypothetical protein